MTSEQPTTSAAWTSSPVLGAIPKHFEWSRKLDSNSLQALQHDDDEDQVHQSNMNYSKQKQKQESLKKFKPGVECEVCKDTASGIHYGVTVCNGCKTFFRRVVIENRTYSCKKSGNCPINKDMRCTCRHCRFKKCLKVGMDSSELNAERQRKRKSIKVATPQTNIDTVKDPLIQELLVKERKFLNLLTSAVAPIHSTITEALANPDSSFIKTEEHQRCQMRPGDQTNFSYWRAKILSAIVEWAKSFDEFLQLSPPDQQSLIVHSAFSNLVLSEAYHTPEQYTDRIVFPDGLSGFRNLTANILKERSGLIPTVVAVINHILVPIRRMRMTEVEYVLLQSIIFFDPECLSLSDAAVSAVSKKRADLLHSLRSHLRETMSDIDSAYRFAALLLRITNVHKVAAFKRETFCTIETFNLMSPHPLTMEMTKKYADVSFF